MNSAASAATARYLTALAHEGACRAAITRHIERCDVCRRPTAWDNPNDMACAVLDSALSELLIAQVIRTEAEAWVDLVYNPDCD